MKTILYNPIFINPQAYYVFPRLTRYLQPDNESTAEPANYIGTIEVKVIAYGDTTLKRTYTNTDSIDLSEFKNTWVRISLFTKVGSCVLGEWKIGNMESDLPYIDPEVLASLKAVVIVGNKTNNDSDRAIVKNLVDPDNPFVISNAAFKLNSGFGKYEQDFTKWTLYTGVKCTDSIISLDSSFNKQDQWILFKPKGSNINQFTINIKGIPDGGNLYLRLSTDSNIKLENGINEISSYTNVTNSTGFFIGANGLNLDWSNLVIEQVGEYEGAYCLDGVDDFVTIPTVTGGKQVLMKVNWQSIAGTAILYDQRTNGGFAIFNRDYDTNENKVPAYRARNIGGNTYIDGILNEYIYASQLQNITHNIVELYDPELNIGTLNPKIGSSYLNSNYAQMSLYDFMLFDNISTDDKIKQLNEYVGIEGNTEWRKTK